MSVHISVVLRDRLGRGNSKCKVLEYGRACDDRGTGRRSMLLERVSREGKTGQGS